MKTLTLTPDQVKDLKVLLSDYDALCRYDAERYYSRVIFRPDFPGQLPVEKYMKGNHTYKAFERMQQLVNDHDSQLEQYTHAFEKSVLCDLFRKRYESSGEFQEIFDNCVNALIDAKVDIELVPDIKNLGTTFICGATREGRNYWKKIYSEIGGTIQ